VLNGDAKSTTKVIQEARRELKMSRRTAMAYVKRLC
jgi:hypothetical protein